LQSSCQSGATVPYIVPPNLDTCQRLLARQVPCQKRKTTLALDLPKDFRGKGASRSKAPSADPQVSEGLRPTRQGRLRVGRRCLRANDCARSDWMRQSQQNGPRGLHAVTKIPCGPAKGIQRLAAFVSFWANFLGSCSNFCLQSTEQKWYVFPSCWLLAAAFSGSTSIPQTGSRATTNLPSKQIGMRGRHTSC
jgi:hypothetical protein